MADAHAEGRAVRSPEQRHRDFERENAEWDRHVKKALEELRNAIQEIKRATSGSTRSPA